MSCQKAHDYSFYSWLDGYKTHTYCTISNWIVSMLTGGSMNGGGSLAGDSICESESWKSNAATVNGGLSTASLVGPSNSTAFMRLHEEPSEKSLNGMNHHMMVVDNHVECV